MSRASLPFLSNAGLIVALVAGITVTATSVERYLDPEGEKYMDPMEPGSADFILTFSGARALVRGVDPYHNSLPELADPWGRGAEIDGTRYNVLYPPSQFVLYAPLAFFVDDPRTGGRVLFWTNLVLLLFLAAVTWWLLVEVAPPSASERQLSLLLIPLLYFVFTANVGTCLGLERGQSDIIGASLCWAGVCLALRGAAYWPSLLIVSAALLKGYALPLAVGVFLLTGLRHGFRRPLAGAGTAVLLLVAPVMPYLEDGLRAARWQAGRHTGKYWFNHGFKNLFHFVWRDQSDLLRNSATLLCVLVAIAAAALAWSAHRRADRRSSVLWTSLFATAALAGPLGYSGASFIYNQVLLLPGLLVFLLQAEHLFRECGLPAFAERGLQLLRPALAFLLLKHHLVSSKLPWGAVALLAIILIWAGCIWRRATSGPSPPRLEPDPAA